MLGPMRNRTSLALAALFATLSVSTPHLARAEEAAQDEDWEDLVVDRVGRKESKFLVVPKEDAKKMAVEPGPSDTPVHVHLPMLSLQHRDDGLPYMDPYFGHSIYPQIGARLLTGFVTERFENKGEAGGSTSRMALAGRADLSLWLLDLRVPFDTQGGTDDRMEIAFKVPFGIGRHRFAPILSVWAPTSGSFSSALLEAGLGYHVTLGGLGLRLQVSGFNGSFDRLRSPAGPARDDHIGGMLGWNGALSYLIGDHLGVMFEADGTTSLSEHSSAGTKVGDTTVRLIPAVRFFPNDSGFRLGLAGLFTFVPDGYDIVRRQGVLFDIGYVFL
jgi:hypothetical protein